MKFTQRITQKILNFRKRAVYCGYPKMDFKSWISLYYYAKTLHWEDPNKYLLTREVFSNWKEGIPIKNISANNPFRKRYEKAQVSRNV